MPVLNSVRLSAMAGIVSRKMYPAPLSPLSTKMGKERLWRHSHLHKKSRGFGYAGHDIAWYAQGYGDC